MPDQLTSKQEQFALVAVQPGATLSGAYRAAYNAEKMSTNAIYVNASQLAADPKIALRMTELRALAADRALVSVQQVLERLALIAFTDVSSVASWDEKGKLTLLPTSEISVEGLATIKSIRHTKGDDLTIELRDPVTALIAIGKHLGMFPTRVEQTGKDGGPIDIEIKALVALFDAVGLSPEQVAALDRALEWQQGEG